MKTTVPKLLLWAVATFVFLIFFFSARYGQNNLHGSGEEDKAIVAQICMPNKTVSYENVEIDQPNSARKVTFSVRPTDIDAEGMVYGQIDLFGDGQWSDSVEYAYLLGDTALNQPVFETVLAIKRNVVALEVKVFSNKNGNVTSKWYWFVPPKAIGEEGFTDWLDPVQDEVADQVHEIGPKTGWLLTHPKKIPVYKHNTDGPKIRYRLTSNHNNSDSDGLWHLTYTELYNKYKDKLSPEEKNKITFIRKKEDAILPNCN